MPMFRKKVLISAEQYIPGVHTPKGVTFKNNPTNHGEDVAVIRTLEGEHMLRPGDWVVTNPGGEQYNVEASIFASTYELVANPK